MTSILQKWQRNEKQEATTLSWIRTDEGDMTTKWNVAYELYPGTKKEHW